MLFDSGENDPCIIVFVTYYMAQPTEDGFVEMEDVTNDLNKVFKKLASPLSSVMNIDAARQGIDL